MATDYFLKIEGIDGEAADKTHNMGEIKIESFNWGENNSSTGGAGASKSRSAGRVTAQDFHFTAAASKASPTLMLNCATGKSHSKAQLFARRAGEGQKDYLEITMTDVFITGYQISGHGAGSDVPNEAVSLNFAKIEVSYKPQDEKGGLGSASKAAYDYVQASKA